MHFSSSEKTMFCMFLGMVNLDALGAGQERGTKNIKKQQKSIGKWMKCSKTCGPREFFFDPCPFGQFIGRLPEVLSSSESYSETSSDH